MTLGSRVLARMAGLGPAHTHRVEVESDLPVVMPDGVVLLADRMYPDIPGADKLPILLARTPYGRGEFAGGLTRLCAERGYQTLTVSCRGTFGSGGNWVPFRNEQADGHAVLEWLASQPWFSGRVGGISGSYCGLTQWAIAEDAPEWFQAWAPGVTSSNFHRLVYPKGVFTLESMLVWITGLEDQENYSSLPMRLISAGRALRKLGNASMAIPVTESDLPLTGHRVDYYREFLAHDEPDDPWWTPIDFGRRLDTIPPASMVAGWYDVFIATQLDDFKALTAAGRQVRLTVGPWTHSTPKGAMANVRDTLDWMDTHLRDQAPTRPDEPVRVFVMGAKQWLDLADWPPPSAATSWYLQPGGRLADGTPPSSSPTTYRYDPRDPTPSVGGASLHPRNSGPKDNRTLESRADVLTFTTDPLTDDLTVIGEIVVNLVVRSSLDHTDFVARLCDVAPGGRSTNLSDGIIRVRPGDHTSASDGSLHLQLVLAPTANTFLKGHRIRLQVASGAHPLYARNPGSGEPFAKATTFVAADQEVFHDPEHLSSLVLPVSSTTVHA